MSKISNKAQLTSIYNRRNVEYGAETSSQLNQGSLLKQYKQALKQVEKECYKPLRGKWCMNIHQVAKANNYDLITTSMKNCRLQRKWGTSDFNLCNELEQASLVLKNYRNYTIAELQAMVTIKNEPIILKAIERHINDEKDRLQASRKERQAKKELLTKKSCEQVKTVFKLKQIYTPCKWSTNVGKVCYG